MSVSPQVWNGFRIIGDNIDKNVKPRFYRIDSQVRSLHYYHSYGLCDRIDFSATSDSKPAELSVHVSIFFTYYTFIMISFRFLISLLYHTRLYSQVKLINRFFIIIYLSLLVAFLSSTYLSSSCNLKML